MPDIEFARAALAWTWSNRGDILGALRTVRAWFRSEPSGRGILIIGPGGAGKSTLARILSGEFDWLLDDPWKYEESLGFEEYTLKDDPKIKVVVPPGQIHRRESSWADVEQNLTAGMYRGLILVNAFGYHTLIKNSYKDHPLYERDKEDFLAKYVDECRRDEMAVSNRVSLALSASPAKVWLLAVVAKEDLWTSDERSVGQFYTGADYADATKAIGATKGASNFRHELIYASLVISNFVTGRGEVLQKNAAGYDHRRSIETIRRLVETIDSLRKWESS